MWATFDTTNGAAIYVDGTLEASDSVLTANNAGQISFDATPNRHLRIGYSHRGAGGSGTNSGFITAHIEGVEIHGFGTRRTQAWITTDYNNQNNPAAFATAGTPRAIGTESSRHDSPITAVAVYRGRRNEA